MTLKQALALELALGGVATEGPGMNKSQEGSGRKLGGEGRNRLKLRWRSRRKLQ